MESPPTEDQPEAAGFHGVQTLEDLVFANTENARLPELGGARVAYGAHTRPRYIQGATGLIIAAHAQLREGDPAGVVLDALEPVLTVSGRERLTVRRAQPNPDGGYDIFLDERIDGLPVIDGGLNVRTNARGEIIVVSSLFVPGTAASRTPALALDAAVKALHEFLVSNHIADADRLEIAPDGNLAFWTDRGNEATPRLVWQVQASYATLEGTGETAMFSLDAITGEVVAADRDTVGLNRTVYSMDGLTDLKAAIEQNQLRLLWNEGIPNAGHSEAFTVYNTIVKPRNIWARTGQNFDTMGIVADFGITNNSAYSRTNTGAHYLAFSHQMFGELDAVAHEYGHGVFRPYFGSSLPRKWWSEWNAMWEFWGDLSAVLTDINEFGGISILNTFKITSLNLRDLATPKSPGVYQYSPGKFQDWYPERRFCCDTSAVAYANSTIFGHAAYLLLNGGQHARVGQSALHGPIPALTIQRVDPFVVQQIFGTALATVSLYNFDVDGLKLKLAATNAAFGLGGNPLAANVANAFSAVGIGYSCSGPPPVPVLNIESAYCRGTHWLSWAANPGDTYHAEAAPAAMSWDFAPTVIDGAMSSCTQNVTGPTRIRMRACNACGCSGWTSDQWMQYYSPCL